MKLKKAAAVLAAVMMTAGMSMTAFASMSYNDYYYDKFGEYPTGNTTDWLNDPVYWGYLEQYDSEEYYRQLLLYTDSGDTSTDYSYYYYDDSSTSSYYALVTSATWNGYTAKWKVDGTASKYEVALYRDDDKVKTVTSKKKSISLSSYITKAGYYYFKVRAYNQYSGWSSWEASEERYFSAATNSSTSSSGVSTTTTSSGPVITTTTTTTTAAATPQWLQAADGSNKWWYRHADGSYTANSFEYINGKWYYFDASGWMKTGWVNANGATYYMGTDGTMTFGVNMIDGVYRTFDSSGKLVG